MNDILLLGRLIFINKEKFLPYDRTKLSKALSTTADKVLLRPESFYKESGVELLLGKEVSYIDDFYSNSISGN